MNLKKSLVSPCRQDIRCLAVGKCILIIAVIARYGDIVLNSIARARYRNACNTVNVTAIPSLLCKGNVSFTTLELLSSLAKIRI